jgi:hypothetical protein
MQAGPRNLRSQRSGSMIVASSWREEESADADHGAGRFCSWKGIEADLRVLRYFATFSPADLPTLRCFAGSPGNFVP